VPQRAELGLGTVQFGSDYGVTNAAGRPEPTEIAEIVDLALASGIRTFDTAPAYGSEQALATALSTHPTPVRLVTKTAPLALERIDDAGIEAVLAAFECSLADLGVDRVAALLVHHAGELTRPGGEQLAAALVQLREQGRAERIGFSVYDPAELEAATAVLEPDIVQLPLNLVDQRFLQSGAIASLAAARVEVHVRSAFLQGALLAAPGDLPPELDGLTPAISRLERSAADAGVSRLAPPLAFCLATPGVSTVLIGTNSKRELEGVMEAACQASDVSFDPSELALNDARLTDPRNWP
jgi:L-glyceraldehyde 3-phosphate reductase